MAREPLYRKAEAEMLRRIQDGEWEVGRRLPNEFGLADEFNVSQGTMRRALITLEGMGLLARKPGRGTIVAKAKPTTTSTTTLTLSDAQGAPVLLTMLRATSSKTRRDDTGLSSNNVVTLERILKRGSARFALDDIAIIETLCSKLPEDAPQELDAILSKLGIAYDHITEHAHADITTMGQSVALSCDRYTPLACITRVAIDANGQAIAKQMLRVISEELRITAQ